MIAFVIYALLLLGLGLTEYRRGRSPDAFYVAGRKSGTFAVAISIVASCVGGSATIGMSALARDVGLPAFWWLGSGAFGLLALVVFLARKVRETGVRTMPEMIERFMGKAAGPIAAVIVVVAWTAITAAQFSAVGRIVSAMAGIPFASAVAAGSALIIVYTMLGGQAAVMRSDIYQYLLVVLGLVILLAWLASGDPGGLADVRFELLNDRFDFGRWTYFMLILGGSYVVCPMLFGRLLSAKNEQTAVAGASWAVLGLVLSGLLIVAIGLYCRGVVPPETPGDAMLTSALTARLPHWLAIVLLLALFSAIVSSADSCLVTASTILSNDLLGRPEVGVCRISTLLLGLGGIVVALWGKGILSLLLAANDIYVCGIVAPVFISMLAHGKRRVDPRIIAAAMVCGGAFGLVAALTGAKMFSYAGLGASAFLSIAALKRRSVEAVSVG